MRPIRTSYHIGIGDMLDLVELRTSGYRMIAAVRDRVDAQQRSQSNSESGGVKIDTLNGCERL